MNIFKSIIRKQTVFYRVIYIFVLVECYHQLHDLGRVVWYVRANKAHSIELKERGKARVGIRFSSSIPAANRSARWGTAAPGTSIIEEEVIVPAGHRITRYRRGEQGPFQQGSRVTAPRPRTPPHRARLCVRTAAGCGREEVTAVLLALTGQGKLHPLVPVEDQSVVGGGGFLCVINLIQIPPCWSSWPWWPLAGRVQQNKYKIM